MSLALIISPAKRMEVVEGPPYPTAEPRFSHEATRLMRAVQSLDYEGCKRLWRCSDKLARLNYGRFREMESVCGRTAAVVSYQGIQYQHLAAQVMDERCLSYLDAHLRILSGFYGLLRPFDGVVPYRLEMQAALGVDGARDLYGFWGDRLYAALREEADVIVNVASVEYSKAVTRHATPDGPRVLTCLFGTPREDGPARSGAPRGARSIVQRATEAKAARGTFVRWCAERGVEDARELVEFRERGYRFDANRSDADTLVFVSG